MGYDIELQNPVTREVLLLDDPHHMCGGIYAVGGTTEARLNVTYNYGKHFRKSFEDEDTNLTEFDKMFGGGNTGIRKLYGMSAVESIPILERAISKLGNDVDSDYWKPTEGNAKQALIQLLTLAKMCPDGIWNGD